MIETRFWSKETKTMESFKGKTSEGHIEMFNRMSLRNLNTIRKLILKNVVERLSYHVHGFV